MVFSCHLASKSEKVFEKYTIRKESNKKDLGIRICLPGQVWISFLFLFQPTEFEVFYKVK